MSMRFANNKRTLCEVLREVNDMHQADTRHDLKVRKRLSECQKMAKKMSKKLYENSKEFDKDWWEENPEYEKAVIKRMGKDYLVG